MVQVFAPIVIVLNENNRNTLLVMLEIIFFSYFNYNR